ncbi:hypothetical protein RRG08_017760 [Elysia crispata]|uniref:G-protein coupled receptors family 1 profile domain-containing protein n=1 Tax=Elysia crispata TaxID=231223 RepID=A0AAE0XR11_9GAST|nr:hypothetical protein RRG08_017760 [Elysia crispata]
MADHNTSLPVVDVQANDSFHDLAIHYIGLFLKMYLTPALCFVGVFINLINVVVFFKMGLSQGLTQNFFILSLIDGITSAANLVNAISYIMFNMPSMRGSSIDETLQDIMWVTLIIWAIIQQWSLVTTLVIALVRCCCVTMPLRVKQILTTRRQLYSIVGFSLLSEVMLVYGFASTERIRIIDPSTNLTLIAYVGKDYDKIDINVNVFQYTCYIIVTVCTIILIISLNQSSKFRDQSSSATGGTEKQKEKSKEVRIVQTVILIATIFIIFNVPGLLLAVFRRVLPGFSGGGRLHKEHYFLIIVMESGVQINAVVNIFIYLGYNSRYLSIVKEFLKLGKTSYSGT